MEFPKLFMYVLLLWMVMYVWVMMYVMYVLWWVYRILIGFVPLGWVYLICFNREGGGIGGCSQHRCAVALRAS